MFLYLPPIPSLWKGKVLALGNLSSSEKQFLSSRNVFLIQVLGQESDGLWSPVLWVGGSHWAACCAGAWRRPGGGRGLLPCLASLLEDVALVGKQTHEAKDEEEQPHQTCLPPIFTGPVGCGRCWSASA